MRLKHSLPPYRVFMALLLSALLSFFPLAPLPQARAEQGSGSWEVLLAQFCLEEQIEIITTGLLRAYENPPPLVADIPKELVDSYIAAEFQDSLDSSGDFNGDGTVSTLERAELKEVLIDIATMLATAERSRQDDFQVEKAAPLFAPVGDALSLDSEQLE